MGRKSAKEDGINVGVGIQALPTRGNEMMTGEKWNVGAERIR